MAIRSVRGMPDIRPEQAGAWRYLEQTAQRFSVRMV
jgi:histidyl-tRNA synthetase